MWLTCLEQSESSEPSGLIQTLSGVTNGVGASLKVDGSLSI
jgi:hypothetical protein